MKQTTDNATSDILTDKNLAFIGAGNMAEAILKGIIHQKLAAPSRIAVSEPLESRRDYILKTYGVRGDTDNANLVRAAEIVIIAVKPQVLAGVLADLYDVSGPEKLFISVVAGVSAASIAERLKLGTRIVRTIPNTPAMVLEGTIGIASDANASAEDLAMVCAIFESIGKTVMIEEKLMDVATGLSGSGPAYAFLMIEALADGAVRMGMARDVAVTSAAQTLLGASRLLLESGRHPGELKDMVTSPGGTTAAGLHQLEMGGVRAALMNAVEAATRRSEELGKS